MLRIIGGLVVYGLAAFGAYSGLQHIRSLTGRVVSEPTKAAQSASGEAADASQDQSESVVGNEQVADAETAAEGTAAAQA